MRQADEHDRVLATVMYVQIPVEIFDQSGIYIRRQLDLFKGREVPFDNGGMLATFSGPARAIRCAVAIKECFERLGVRLKTGLHTGECDVVGGQYSGFAVRLANCIGSEAEPGNILVSRTVKDLVAGSGFEFEDYGLRSFEDCEGEWRLFTVKL